MAPFPDIDMQLPIKHRGPTHSVWFAILMGMIYAVLLLYAGPGELSVLQLSTIGFISGFVGVIGHMIGDMITPMGVAPFEPLSSYWKGFGLVNAGDKRANRVLMQAGAISFGVGILLGSVDISVFIDPFVGFLG